eukprot:scaffold33221_cov55-Phaeocystis_antarctica.AAC.1
MGSARRSASSTNSLSGPLGVRTATRSHSDTEASTPHVVHSGRRVADLVGVRVRVGVGVRGRVEVGVGVRVRVRDRGEWRTRR